MCLLQLTIIYGEDISVHIIVIEKEDNVILYFVKYICFKSFLFKRTIAWNEYPTGIFSRLKQLKSSCIGTTVDFPSASVGLARRPQGLLGFSTPAIASRPLLFFSLLRSSFPWRGSGCLQNCLRQGDRIMQKKNLVISNRALGGIFLAGSPLYLSACVCVRQRECVWVSLMGKRSGGGEKCTLTILPSLKEPVPKKYNISRESSFMAESVD